ncbi:hypothetical protein [Malaciobacter marinus]|jgi:hypothetical protein
MKKLCKIKKAELESLKKQILKEIKKPKFYCTKCFRVAKHEQFLCNYKSL